MRRGHTQKQSISFYDTRKRKMSATREFKINSHSISPNSSAIPTKKKSTEIHKQRNKRSTTNFYKGNRQILIPSQNLNKRGTRKAKLFDNTTPLSSIQKKIKNMLSRESMGESQSRLPMSNTSDYLEKRKIHRKSNSMKSDILSKYFHSKPKHNQSGKDLSITLARSSLAAERRKKSTGGIGLSSTLGRKNLNDTILKKYRDSNHTRKDSLKQNSLYQKFVNKKLLAKNIETGGNPWHLEKNLSRQKKNRTLSNNLRRQAPEANKSSKRKSQNVVKRQNNKKKKSAKRTFRDGNNREAALSFSESKGKGMKMSWLGGNKTMKPSHAESVGQIRIAEFEEKRPLSKNLKKERKLSFPNLQILKKNEHNLPPFQKSKVIIKDFGKIAGFAVNTHQGTVRNYNEDRVSILLNAQQR